MYIDFKQLPAHSRVWIYQASRDFTSEEVEQLTHQLHRFTADWDTHGKPLLGSFQLLYNRFVILAVDQIQHAPSGCSIDKSVAVLKEIETQFNLSLFDRTQIAFLDQNQKLFTVPISRIRSAVNEGKITENTLAFNNLVIDVQHLNTEWKAPAHQTWLKKYFAVTAS